MSMYLALKSTNWGQNLKFSSGDGNAILCGHPILYCAVPSLLELFQHHEYCFSPGDPNRRPPALQSSSIPTELILPRFYNFHVKY